MKAIGITTPGIHHVALRSVDLARSKKFYNEVLGFHILLDTENLCIVGIGNFALAIKGPDSSTELSDRFSPFRVGLDHLALAATNQTEIDRVAKLLRENNIWTEGPKIDSALGKYYLAFKDPDGIKLEFYMV